MDYPRGLAPFVKFTHGCIFNDVFSLGFLHQSGKFVLIIRFVDTGVSKSSKIVEAQSKKDKKVIDVPEAIEYKPRAARKQKNLFSQIRNIEDGKKENT